MITWDQLSNPQLDIVGIVAVLGEGSTTRNAQASALGWHHVLPRLLPAPQALLKHEHEKRLPTKPGTVVGAYSGNVRFELNFFCQLLHPDNLKPNEVELVKVRHRRDDEKDDYYLRMRKWFKMQTKTDDNELGNSTTIDDEPRDDDDAGEFFKAGEQAYGVKRFGLLSLLSASGCLVSIGLLVGSACAHDGFALVATLLLSFTSTVVGAASWWRLDFKEDPPKAVAQKDRQKIIPHSDVVIYYPHGAFRIIRCSENISRLYFRNEICEYVFPDNAYRVLALFASVFLMVGLLCMGNADLPMKIAFAASYIGLNMVYWLMSALNPTGSWGHWKHRYKCTRVPVLLPDDVSLTGPQRSFTTSSLQNKQVITQESISPTDTNRQSLDGTNLMRIQSSKDDSQPNGHGFVHINGIGSRTNTSHEQAPPSAGSPLDEKITEEPETMAQNAVPSRSRTTTFQAPEVGKSDVKVHDSEHGEETRSQRIEQRLSAARAGAIDLLNKLRLISKRDTGPKSETFTTALWKAIAVTGSTRWLHQTHIAPDNEVWTAWIKQAGKKAETRLNQHGQRVSACTKDGKGSLVLPVWGYQTALNELFAKESNLSKLRPPPPRLLKIVEEVVQGDNNQRTKVDGITPEFEERLVEQARLARQRVRRNFVRRTSTAASSQLPTLSLITDGTARRSSAGSPAGSQSVRRRRNSGRLG